VTIPCDLVITAIGYEATTIPGVKYEAGKIANIEGRVVGSNIYTVGWAKRGPSGVIGTNKSDAAEVVKLLISDLKDAKTTGDIAELLTGNHNIVDQAYWVRINSAEVAAGEPRGKPRVKAVSVPDLLRLGQP
jgi:ferredoxin--NADP+ reductase